MPRYAALIYGTEETGEPNPELWGKIMAEYMHFGEVAGAAGVIGGGEALQPTNMATTIQVTGGAKGGDVIATDGPFAETKEALGGFYLLDCKDLDEALELGRADPRRVARPGRGAAGHRHERDGLIDPLDEIIRIEGGQVLATLIRLTGDIDRAEDALHDALVVAADVWRRDGVPDKPGAWLTTVARNKELDRIRREARRAPKEVEAFRLLTEVGVRASDVDNRDDRLRLLFTCCHPALSPESQVASGVAHDLRIDDRRHRSGVPRSRGDDRSADQSGQGEDRQGAHPVPGP